MKDTDTTAADFFAAMAAKESVNEKTEELLNQPLHYRSPEGGNSSTSRILKFEREWHRSVVAYAAANWNTNDIAKALAHLGVTPAMVKTLRRAPWFQQKVLDLMNINGSADIFEMFKREAVQAHFKLVELRDDEATPKTVVANICRDQIERVYGKATQRVEVGQMARSADPVAEVARLEAENKRLVAATRGGLS